MMNSINELVNHFLSQRTIAVAGVSEKKQTPANGVYKKLKSLHYNVVALNPHLHTFDGDPCYPDLRSVPVHVDALFTSTRPETTEQIVDQCIAQNVSSIWMHNFSGLQYTPRTSSGSSVSHSAVQKCRDHNIAVIAGTCPMMFIQPRDTFHSLVRWFLSVTGKLRIKETAAP